MANEKLFTKDIRTGKPISVKKDGVAIMDPVKVMEVKKFSRRNTKTNEVTILEKPVYYYKTLGWVFKTNLQEGDLSREKFMDQLGRKPYFLPVTNQEHLDRLQQDFEEFGFRRQIHVE